MESITWNDAANYRRCYELTTTTPQLKERLRVCVWASGPKSARTQLERHGYTVSAVRLVETRTDI